MDVLVSSARADMVAVRGPTEVIALGDHRWSTPGRVRVVGSPIPVGKYPHGVAVSPDGRRLYVTNTATRPSP